MSVRFSRYFSALSAAALLAGAFLFTSCHSDNEVEDPCLRPDYKSSVKVSLDVDVKLSKYKDVSFADDLNRQTRSAEQWQLRYTVCAFQDGKSNEVPVASVSSLSPELELSLPLGKYNVVAWADYVSDGSLSSRYFHTDDFSDILLKDKFSYSGIDSHKIGFLGSESLTVSYRTPELKIALSPAMGQYRINATDSPDYTVGKVLVTYPQGVPSSLNVLSGKICHKWYGVSFETIPAGEVAFDNVFAESKEIKVAVKIEVFDDSGRLRARRNFLDIPLVRGGVTFVNAKIYTILDPDSGDAPSGGGMGIDGDYDDSFVIEFSH